MYRLMVVDDEDYIVDGLIDLFEERFTAVLEYCRAYSAGEALDWLKRTKIDIVLTDIRMPGMTGLELHEQIVRTWPQCRVIFLTGYNDFEYIQSAMRNESVDYILKTESDDVIVQAVDKAVYELQHRFESEQLIADAKKRLQTALPIMQKELLWDLLNGEVSRNAIHLQFKELSLTLRADRPVLLVLGRVDGWNSIWSPSDRMLLVYALQNIASDYLSDFSHHFSIFYEQAKLVWLIQFKNEEHSDDNTPDSRLMERLHQVINGAMESIQAASKQYLQLPVSFLTASETVAWSECAEKYSLLKMMLHVHYGIQDELLLMESNLPASPGRPASRTGIFDLRPREWALLQSCLEKGHKQQFQELFLELVKLVPTNQQWQDGLSLHIHHSLLSIYFTHLHQSGMSGEGEDMFGYERVIASGPNRTWGETAERLWQMAEAIFERQNSALVDREREVIRKVKQYIGANLAGDLSLTRIGGEVGFSPSYLSRLYKQITGEGLSDYIVAERLQLAKELLAKQNMRIHDIAEALGFDSPAYFARFFKKQTGTTPTEYRELL
ncbi:response regulator [Cohnella phaseoli]|uniref:Two-component system response regulator YesN n=1 Tax=Cohnella phaseoli TaxID=456490 RepID=A0A3D9HUU1_9BACL|nr:response regulator [Cohnella phaseoli]RED53209.1 two-component system response regulator YesN [Cohnella phaseoli]